MSLLRTLFIIPNPRRIFDTNETLRFPAQKQNFRPTLSPWISASVKMTTTTRLSFRASKASLRIQTLPFLLLRLVTVLWRTQDDRSVRLIALSWWGACLMVLLCTAPVLAGHSFMTAFGNIEWLPEPGRTPDSIWYGLDAIQEEGKLLLAGDSAAKLQLCLSFAREKLAELEAMVKTENAQAAQIAADRYQAYIARAKTLIDEQSDQAKKEALAENMANALLEHRYILSVDYPDLPASTRMPILKVAADAGEQYQEVVKLLSPKKKGALFFKEEEVRWSLQMAERADEETEKARSQ